jgi:uncharacterized membrane protein
MNKKLKSRTFWFAVAWTLYAFVITGLEAVFKIQLPVAEGVWTAAGIVLVYIGGNKIIDAKHGPLDKEP